MAAGISSIRLSRDPGCVDDACRVVCCASAIVSITAGCIAASVCPHNTCLATTCFIYGPKIPSATKVGCACASIACCGSSFVGGATICCLPRISKAQSEEDENLEDIEMQPVQSDASLEKQQKQPFLSDEGSGASK